MTVRLWRFSHHYLLHALFPLFLRKKEALEALDHLVSSSVSFEDLKQHNTI